MPRQKKGGDESKDKSDEGRLLLTVSGLFSLAEARFLPSPPGKLLERCLGAFLLR